MHSLTSMCVILFLASPGNCGLRRRQTREAGFSCSMNDCSSLSNPPPLIPSICFCRKCRVNIIGWNCTTDVRKIIQEENCITSVDKDRLKRFQEVAELDLTCNAIAAIPSHAFGANKNLKKLTLASNRLQNLTSKSFAGLDQLQELDLSYNRLQHLPEEVFSNLSAMKKLLLPGNKISFVNVHWFPVNLVVLHMGNNALASWRTDDDRLKELDELGLSRNKITSWNRVVYPKLTTLDLSYNNMEKVAGNAFQANPSLHTLDLSNNRLKTLDRDLTNRLCLLKVFDIANNQLLTPYPTWFANVFKNCIERDVFAMATNNPWDCTHAREMQDFITAITTDNTYSAKKKCWSSIDMCDFAKKSVGSVFSLQSNFIEDPLDYFLSPPCLKKVEGSPTPSPSPQNSPAPIKYAITIFIPVSVGIVLMLIGLISLKNSRSRKKHIPASQYSEETSENTSSNPSLIIQPLQEDEDGYLLPSPEQPLQSPPCQRSLQADTPVCSTGQAQYWGDHETIPKAPVDCSSESNKHVRTSFTEDDETFVKTSAPTFSHTAHSRGICPGCYGSLTNVGSRDDVTALTGYFTLNSRNM